MLQFLFMDTGLSYEEYVARLLNDLEESRKRAKAKKSAPRGRPESSGSVPAPGRMVVTSEIGRSRGNLAIAPRKTQ